MSGRLNLGQWRTNFGRGCLPVTKRQTQDYLQDILDAVAAIEQFTTGIEFEAFSQNLEKVFAV